MGLVSSETTKLRIWARWGAILWTLLIFILCLWPGEELPRVQVPLADKWAHFIVFGVFALLWLGSFHPPKRKHYFSIILIAAFAGWLIEWLQGAFPTLNRSEDQLDTLADAIGGILGALIYGLVSLMKRG